MKSLVILSFFAFSNVVSASPSQQVGVYLANSQVILVNASQTSCISSKSTTPTSDVAPLSADLGHVQLHWNAPSPNSTLNIVYYSVKWEGSGLVNDQVMTVTGEELSCLTTGNPFRGSTLSAVQSPIYTNTDELLLGGIKAADPSLSTPFSGVGHLTVYGLIQTPGQQDVVATGSTDFSYNFGAINQ
jgi:hypothetical protein